MSVSNYDLKKELPSIFVTKDLIKTLRSNILNKMKILGNAGDDVEKIELIEKSFSISIEDKAGTHTIQSIEEFEPSKFPDSTKSIKISYRSPSSYLYRDLDLYDIRIRIVFNSEKYSSRTEVSCKSPDAKATAIGIASNINDLIAPHCTSVRWLHPRPYIDGMLFVLVPSVTILLIMVISKAPNLVSTALIMFVCSLNIYYWLLPGLRWFRPYTEFETRSTENKLKWWNWFVTSFVLGFLVLGVIMTPVKDWLLHLFVIAK
jgi:hypothetical protein